MFFIWVGSIYAQPRYRVYNVRSGSIRKVHERSYDLYIEMLINRFTFVFLKVHAEIKRCGNRFMMSG